jgi:hypothetical protein
MNTPFDLGRVKGRKSPRKLYRFSIHDIVKASGKGIWTVRKDRQRRKLDPHDLASLAAYVAGKH